MLKPATETPVSEKRTLPRIEATEDFLVEFPSKNTRFFASGSGVDISEEGVGFATYEPLKPGTWVMLTFYFSRKFHVQRSIQMRARVVRCEQSPKLARFRVACEISHDDLYSRAYLQEFMAWREQQPKMF